MTREANSGASQHRARAGGVAQHADRRAGALERITVGRWRARAGAMAALVCAAWAQTALPASDLPDLGDPSTSALSVLEEKRLGQQFMRQARQQLEFVEDPELVGYVRALGQGLVASSDAPGGYFRFYLVRDPNLNAFAAPGGHIAVHTGLILAASGESELAGVLAHEIAHVTQRHLPRMIERSKRQSLPAAAAMAAAILLGGQAGQAALVATNAAVIESQLRYTRDFEREADAIGIRTLTESGFDANGMVTFFKQMEQWSRIRDGGVPEFLRTHPLTPDRVAEAETRASRAPPPTRLSNSDFLHMRNKIRATFDGRPEQTALHFESELRDGRAADEMASRYGMALGLMRSAQHDRARSEIRRLLEAAPDYGPYLVAYGEIEMAAGAYDAALAAFAAGVERNPGYPPLTQLYAEALIKTGHAEQAKPILREQIRANPEESGLYGLYARAAGESGAAFESYQALGEYYYLQGELRTALDQLYTARRHAGDSFYATSSVDARIQEIEEELRRLEDR